MIDTKTIYQVKLGDSVRSLVDGAIGTVVDADGVAIKIQWKDGVHSIFQRRDGFTLFVLRQQEAEKREKETRRGGFLRSVENALRHGIPPEGTGEREGGQE